MCDDATTHTSDPLLLHCFGSRFNLDCVPSSCQKQQTFAQNELAEAVAREAELQLVSQAKEVRAGQEYKNCRRSSNLARAWFLSIVYLVFPPRPEGMIHPFVDCFARKGHYRGCRDL